MADATTPAEWPTRGLLLRADAVQESYTETTVGHGHGAAISAMRSLLPT